MTPKDSKGRERRPEQDAALKAFNEERKHAEGVIPKSHNIAMSEEAHQRLAVLTPRARGILIEDALDISRVEPEEE